MNELETENIYCPFFAAAAIVRDGDLTTENDSATHCLGDLCAFWRWTSAENDDHDGYCGIAGEEKVKR